MMFGYGNGAWHPWAAVLMGVGMLVFLVLVICGMVALFRISGSGRSSGDSDPNQILKERLTRGEIDIEDYKRRRDLISSSRKGSGPSSFRFSSFGRGNHDDGGTCR
jgi:putative membrane protein